LTTDIIVGFPGETEQEFDVTYKFLKEIKFSKMHIFKYSVRKGTVAAKMENQIDGNIKEERSSKLIKLSNENETEFLESNVGKTLDVLFETKKDEGYTEGHTSNYITVEAKGEGLENTIRRVEIDKREKDVLIGKIV